MKKFLKIVLVSICLLSVLAFAAAATDEAPTSGYVIAIGGGETNIKWTIEESGADVKLSFEIDSAATDKKATTILYGANKENNSEVGYAQGNKLAWGALYINKITHISIGDGITEIKGGIANCFSALTTVEIPTSLTKINGKTFEGCGKLKSITVRGNAPEEGVADIGNVTELGSYIFDNCKQLKTFKINENYSGKFDSELFKYTAIKEITIPAGVTAIGSKAFESCGGLEQIWCYSTNYTLAGNAFANCGKIAYIYGVAGTPLEEFCRSNDISFRNINNPDEYIFKSSKAPEIFDPTGATAYGNLTSMWEGKKVVDTYWLYYEDTKTLKFISNMTGWNETGAYESDKENKAYYPYAENIEHVIIGKNLQKCSVRSFQGMDKLKSVELGPNVSQLDLSAFSGCKSLTTIYRAGNEPIEGTADLTGITKIGDYVFGDTKIKNFILDANLGEKGVGNSVFPGRAASITCTPNEKLLEFGKEYYVDIIDVATGETVSKNYIEIDENLTPCGFKAVYDFDEATGTLTISGVGPIGDITNYYGGGSKTQYWFSIKQQIKKVVIKDGIIAIGKYAFTECANLEYVELPENNVDILNAAFEKCTSLKSVYKRGNEPIIGHVDLSSVNSVASWCFSNCPLIANITVGDNIEKISDSIFDTCPNLAGVYGTPGGVAEDFATKNSFTFYSAADSKPVDTVCTIPEETSDTESLDTENVGGDTASAGTDTTAPDSETQSSGGIILDIEDDNSSGTGSDSEGEFPTLIVVFIVIAVVAVAAVAVIVVVAKKKKK